MRADQDSYTGAFLAVVVLGVSSRVHLCCNDSIFRGRARSKPVQLN